MGMSTAMRAAFEVSRKHYISFEDLWSWVPEGISLVPIPELNVGPGMPIVQGVRTIRKQDGLELKAVRLVMNNGEIMTLVEGDQLGYSAESRSFWIVRGPNSHKDPLRRTLALHKLPQRLLVRSDEEQVVPWGTHCWGSGEDFQWVPSLYHSGCDIAVSSWKVMGGKVVFFYTKVTWEPCRIEKIVVRTKVNSNELATVFERTIRVLRFEDAVTTVDTLLDYEDEQKQKSKAVAIRDLRARQEAEREMVRQEAEARRAREMKTKRNQEMLEFIVSSDERVIFRDRDSVFSMTPHKSGSAYAIFSKRNGSGIDQTIERESIPETVVEKWAKKIGFKG